MARDAYAGPDTGPAAPFPLKLSGKIIKGFGRGSKELGIPTANIPIAGLDVGGHRDIESGIYYGFAGLNLAHATDASEATQPLGVKGATADGQRPLAGADTLGHSTGRHETAVYPMVMSIGWNPFYKNEVRTVEVHIIHKFKDDFYNAHMNLSILAFIRPERDYKSLDALVEDINTDIEVSKRSLERDAYAKHKDDSFLTDFSWVKPDA